MNGMRRVEGERLDQQRNGEFRWEIVPEARQITRIQYLWFGPRQMAARIKGPQSMSTRKSMVSPAMEQQQQCTNYETQPFTSPC